MSRGNVCALGAIETARGVPKLPRRNTTIIMGDAVDALERALPAGYRSVPVFNDDPHTTKADVLALFDRAIAAEAVKVTADPAHTYTVA
jgi:sugar phosphate isomerase/epimerase